MTSEGYHCEERSDAAICQSFGTASCDLTSACQLETASSRPSGYELAELFIRINEVSSQRFRRAHIRAFKLLIAKGGPALAELDSRLVQFLEYYQLIVGAFGNTIQHPAFGDQHDMELVFELPPECLYPFETSLGGK